MLDTSQVIDLLRKQCAEGAKAFGLKHGISGAYLGDVLRGRREPGAKVLDALGLEKVVGYRKKREPLPDFKLPHDPRD